MQGLQRATEAARASRGLPPRIVHARSLSGGNNTRCGRGGVTFSAPIADTTDEVTCKNCLKVQRSLESYQQTVGLFQDARWNQLRADIREERNLMDEAAADHSELHGHEQQEERAYGRVEECDRILALMDRMENGQ